MNIRKLKFRLIAGMATAIAVVLIAAPASAATCSVTSTADSGSGTLREKLSDAACTEIIFAPAIVPGTINLVTYLPAIDRNVKITGPGQDKMTVLRSQDAPTFAIFGIFPNAVVTISGLTIANGSQGIYNAGTLTVANSTITGNIAPPQYSGGGIQNNGTLVLEVATVTANRVSAGGGGAGILNNGALTIRNSTISGNTVADTGGGGGLYNNGTLTISNSTFSGNASGYYGGGGISLGNGSATITNTTIASNTGGNGGGGINVSSGSATITHSTIANNTGGIFLSPYLPPQVTLKNTIVAANGINCYGTPLDGGGNLTYPGGSQRCPGTIADPRLRPLADNGGPTKTMFPLPDSPALDTAFQGSGCPTTDQRGVIRPQGTGCDVGAVEAVVAFSCPAGVTQVDLPYSWTLAGYGGQPPYSWSVVDGLLPTGLMLNGATGTISGNPTVIATFHFSVRVVDSSTTPYATATSSCSIVVVPLDSTPPAITPNITGTLTNSWYTGNVGVGWTVTDNESTITSRTGCDAATVTSDTTGVTFTCAATSSGGTASRSVTIQRDATAPNLSCGAADGLWHASDVGTGCTASDFTSGLLNTGEAVFNLSTSTPGGTETANASTNSRSIADRAGNSAVAGPIGGNKIDKKAPNISITSPTAISYLLNQAVPANYSCADGGSGTASCAGPVASGVNINTASAGARTFEVSAADNVANASSINVSYTVNYVFSGYSAPVNNAPTVNTGNAGRTYPVAWQLRDGNGSLISALSAVTAVTYQATSCGAFASAPTDALEASTTGNSGLRYDSTANRYQYNWASPRATGCYTLFLRLDSGQVFPAYFNLN